MTVMERSTRQRTAIRDTLAQAGRPLLPQEILSSAHAQVPGLGIATVYRNLKALVEEGVLKPVDLPGQSTRYEVAHRAHHHHFQCRDCQRVFDIHACPGDLSSLAPAGFVVDEHEINLYGYCRDCAEKAGRRRASGVTGKDVTGKAGSDKTGSGKTAAKKATEKAGAGKTRSGMTVARKARVPAAAQDPVGAVTPARRGAAKEQTAGAGDAPAEAPAKAPERAPASAPGGRSRLQRVMPGSQGTGRSRRAGRAQASAAVPANRKTFVPF